MAIICLFIVSILLMNHYIKSSLYLILIVIFLGSCGSASKSIKSARAALNRGEYEVAADHFKKAYKRISPKERKLRGQIAFEMGETYNRYGNVARAIAAYKNAERYKYNDTLVYQQLGMLSAQMGNYKDGRWFSSFLLQITRARSCFCGDFCLCALKGLLWEVRCLQGTNIGRC